MEPDHGDGGDDVGRRLAGRLARRDPDAIRDIYRAYGRLVYSVARRVVGDHGLAEEATQQAFMKLWQAADRVDPERDVRPLLCTIARRAALDIAEREQRRAAVPLDERMPAGTGDDGQPERAWTVWRVREAIDGLPAEERDVVRLQHLEGYSHQEIANRLAVPIGTVKSRSNRAHHRLAAVLGQLREEVT